MCKDIDKQLSADYRLVKIEPLGHNSGCCKAGNEALHADMECSKQAMYVLQCVQDTSSYGKNFLMLNLQAALEATADQS